MRTFALSSLSNGFAESDAGVRLHVCHKVLHLQRSRAFLTHTNVAHVCGQPDNEFRTAAQTERKDYRCPEMHRKTQKDTCCHIRSSRSQRNSPKLQLLVLPETSGLLQYYLIDMKGLFDGCVTDVAFLLSSDRVRGDKSNLCLQIKVKG